MQNHCSVALQCTHCCISSGNMQAYHEGLWIWCSHCHTIFIPCPLRVTYKLLCQSFRVQIVANFLCHLMLDVANFATDNTQKSQKMYKSELIQLLSVLDYCLQSSRSVSSCPDWGCLADELRNSVLYCLDNLMLLVFTLMQLNYRWCADCGLVCLQTQIRRVFGSADGQQICCTQKVAGVDPITWRAFCSQ